MTRVTTVGMALGVLVKGCGRDDSPAAPGGKLITVAASDEELIGTWEQADTKESYFEDVVEFLANGDFIQIEYDDSDRVEVGTYSTRDGVLWLVPEARFCIDEGGTVRESGEYDNPLWILTYLYAVRGDTLALTALCPFGGEFLIARSDRDVMDPGDLQWRDQ